MVVTTSTVDIANGTGQMRMLVTEPRDPGAVDLPGVVLYSDIFQITGPQVRVSTRLAGYGFVVATPEIWSRLEPPGTAIPFDDAGRTRGLDDAKKTSVADMDRDCRAAIDWLSAHPRVRKGAIGAMGFCIGGHLAFRAALQPEVRASACFYPTGVHDGRLGSDADAGTLARVKEISGALLLVYGSKDPHVPDAARATIDAALREAGVRFETALFDAEHAFLRDEGPRWDPESADLAWARAIAFLRSGLGR
ncbi:MAG: dienelactone hydrolase family protein [Deltaproteobacteria bacterium]|nr:dienelactone hydrolase family protein [Deltaproteobacteria bacterium]